MIYNDCRLNSVRGVYKNIYQSFCISAMKMHYYIRSWKPDMDRSAQFIASKCKPANIVRGRLTSFLRYRKAGDSVFLCGDEE